MGSRRDALVQFRSFDLRVPKIALFLYYLVPVGVLESKACWHMSVAIEYSIPILSVCIFLTSHR